MATRVSTRHKSLALDPARKREAAAAGELGQLPAAAALYLYGVGRGTPAPQLPALPGVDLSGQVRALEIAGLTCWVSTVGRREFAERLNQNMQDLDWLAAASVRHQEAVAALAKHGDVLPARFATVFLTPATLEQHVQREKSRLLAALRRIGGCEEWGVKVFAVPRSAPPPAAVTKSGRDYLAQKAASLQVRVARTRGPEIEKFAEALKQSSRDSAASGTMSQKQPGLQWQATFLVPRDHRVRFINSVEQFAKHQKASYRVECTGPWPPYSFVNAGQSAATPARSQPAPPTHARKPANRPARKDRPQPQGAKARR